MNGAPFYVMAFVDGLVLRDQAAATSITPEARRNASCSIADTMAKIHAVDPDAVGLGDLGKKEDYIARQLKRWYGQWEKSKTRELPLVDEIHDALLAKVPEQGAAAIVHGDYRLDNCMTDTDGNVIAVLDWEICTLGEPARRRRPLDGLLDRTGRRCADAAHRAHHAKGLFPQGGHRPLRRAERYATSSQIDYCIAFGYWKLACMMSKACIRALHRWGDGEHRPEGLRRLQGAGGPVRRTGR